RLAERQRFCPLMDGVRLGATGRPHKLTVKGVTTFVCCEGCVQAAQDDPDQALAKIRALEQTRAQELPLPAPCTVPENEAGTKGDAASCVPSVRPLFALCSPTRVNWLLTFRLLFPSHFNFPCPAPPPNNGVQGTSA